MRVIIEQLVLSRHGVRHCIGGDVRLQHAHQHFTLSQTPGLGIAGKQARFAPVFDFSPQYLTAEPQAMLRSLMDLYPAPAELAALHFVVVLRRVGRVAQPHT